MELELVSKDTIDQHYGRQTVSESDTPVYTGTEHRKNIRRVTVDRREMVRFESKSDRRDGKERRLSQKLWSGRDT